MSLLQHMAVHSQQCSMLVIAPLCCVKCVKSATTHVPSSSNNRDNYHRTLEALKSKNRRPKRWMGQNYMVNSEVNDNLVKAADIHSGDLVLEIGPGTGSLTAALVRAGAYVIAVEKDPDMASLVAKRFEGHPQVELHEEDFMKWHIRLHLANWISKLGTKASAKQVKVVSNLPFNITTDVLRLLLPMGDVFSRVVLLLQDEAATRIVDEWPDVDEYRFMSIFTRFYSGTEYKFKVERCNFFPKPPVNGAVVCFTLKRSSQYPQVTSVKSFFTMVQSAFNGKRKMLRTSLRHLHESSDVETALKAIGFDETARPHELRLGDFVALYNTLELTSVKHD